MSLRSFLMGLGGPSSAVLVGDEPTDAAGHPPPEAIATALRLLEALDGDTRRCGDTATSAGWWIETHTLGCRNAADDPEAEWVDRHWAIWDEYRADGKSVVIGTPEDGGIFVTLTPLRRT